MKFFYLLLAGLATFRLALLFSKEDGPGFIFRKLRRLPPPKSSTRQGAQCSWCWGVWFAALATTYLWWLGIVPGKEWPLWWLATSAIAVCLNQQFTKD